MNYLFKQLGLLRFIRRKHKTLSEAQIIVYSFMMILLPSTLMLMLPWFSISGLNFLDALFTATSALTVTGLGVIDTGTHFTLAGKVLLLCLMEIGGLGQMTLSTLLVVMVGIKMSLKQKALTQAQLNLSQGMNITKLIKKIIIFALTSQLFGTLLLCFYFIPQFGIKTGFFYSLFHAISAFNNAGFSLFSDSLIGLNVEPIVIFTISGLIILGGLGFTVVVDIWRCRCPLFSGTYFLFFKFERLSLHSKIMIIGTIALIIGGTLAIYVLERHNPQTFMPLDEPEKWLISFFQSVTARTAGFNSINLSIMTTPTLFIMILLMLIGAGSTSTGGGLKVTTIAITVRAGISYLRQNAYVTLFKRTVSWQMVNRALAMMMISGIVIIFAIFLLLVTENAPLQIVVFEVVSAFSTVGLSVGLTSQLTEIGKFILIIVMLIGRIGPITIFYLLAAPKSSHIKYVEGNVMVG